MAIFTSYMIAGNIYYIDANNGNDQNDGLSLSTAWLTLDKANSILQAGDSVYIRGGEYSSQMINPANSGSSGQYITYQNYQEETPIISGLKSGAHFNTGKDYIKLDGITTDGTGEYGVRMMSSHNLIQNCFIKNVLAYKGIYGSNTSHYNLIQNNTVDYIGETEEQGGNDMGNGIQTDGNYNIIQFNTVYHCGHNCIEIWGDYNIIRNNYMENEWGRCLGNIGESNQNKHHLVEDNILYNTQLISDGFPNAGYQCQSAYTVFRRNRIYHIGGSGLHLDSSNLRTPSYMKIYHNVIYDCGKYQTNQWDCGIDLTEHDDGSLNQVDARNNIFYANNTDGVSYRDYADPADHNFTYNHWNINGNPQFVKEGSYNFHLREDSPCIDAGTWLTYTTSSGSGNQIQVQDASYFCDGFGIITGDFIQLQGQLQTYRITSINYSNNTIYVNESLSWSSGQGISLPYSGNFPDMGLFEYASISPLQVEIEASSSSGYAPLSVIFTASASGGTAPYTYSWDFGDGSLSSNQNPSHTYSTAGDYPVILAVTDHNDEQDTASLNISISQQVVAMQATANASPASGTIPFLVNFTADATGGVSPYTFSWDFGDGSSSSDQNPTHTYSTAADYIVILTVTDSLANEASASVNISAAESIPPLEASVSASPVSGIAPLAVSFTGNATGGVAPYTYSWDFGDGSSSTLQSPSHTYTQSGNFTAKLTVIDNQDIEESESTTISVTAETAETQLSISAVTDLPAPGWGGTTDPQTGNHIFPTGESANISANPNKDYRFAKWTGDISSIQAYEENISLTMDQNKNIQAHFYTRCGDVNGDLKITPTDAQRVFEIFLGLIPNATEAQLENADVNTDGTPSDPKVTPSDAQAIFEKFLGISELPSDCSCKSRAATSQNETFEHISSFPGQEAMIKINDVILVPGEEEIIVPVIITGPFDLKAFGFDLSYPPEVLEFICTESAPFSSDLVQIHANQIADGVIRAGGYSKKPVSVNSENTLINLVFKVRQNSGSPSSLQMINKFDDFQHLTFEGGRLIFPENKKRKKVKHFQVKRSE